MSAKNSVDSVRMEMLADMPVLLPPLPEQKKIAEILTAQNEVIALLQKQIDLLKQQKKGFLQKMFPAKGCKVPEIRFEGVSGDWEEHKIQWLVDEAIIEAPMDGNHGEKHPTAEEYVDNGIPFLMASDIHNGVADIKNCKYISEERANRLDKGFAKNEDILITHKATIGEVAILSGLRTDYAMLTPQVTYYRIKDSNRLSQKYMYAWFNSDSFQKEIKSKAAQSTRAYIGITAQRNLTICLPNSLDEQNAIGDFIYSLDILITLHQRKLEIEQQKKKALMQLLLTGKVRCV